MRHALYLALPLALSLAAPAALAADRLTIVHVNDLDRMEGEGDAGGVARLATVVNRIRAEGGSVFVTNGGDAISPSLLSGFDEGAHMIDLFNLVGLDAMALGNHEFDFGPDVARARIAQAEFAMLSNNAREPDGSLIDGVAESLMLDLGEHQVGVFGLTTATTAVKSSPGDVTFGDPVDVAAAMSASLREGGADLVIALAHTDVREDAALLAAGDVDIILSGDDHRMLVDYDGRAALVESGAQAEFVTVIRVDIETVEGRRGPRVVWRPAFEVVNTAAVAPEPAIEAEVDGYLAFLSRELDIEIGEAGVQLDTRRTSVRSMETGFANLIVDAMRAGAGADVALTNGGGIRGDRIYDAGTVLSRRDVLTELPFGNKTILIEVTGADIRAALENGVSAVEDGSGRFPHVSGMAFTFDAAAEPGARVTAVTVGGAPLDPAATYRLATNDFMGKGGDGYEMFADKPRLIEATAAELMASQVIRWIEAGNAAPQVEGRITRLN